MTYSTLYGINPNITSGEGSCKQSLYRKKTGEYFLVVDGARSDAFHNLALANSIHDREHHIYPLTYKQARAWAEDEMTIDEWVAIFDPADDDSMTALNLTLASTSVNKFRQAAQQQQITQRALMEKLIATL